MVIPKPFKRPSLSVGAPKVKKSWQDVPVHCLDVDDIVADRGKIVNLDLKFTNLVRSLPPFTEEIEVQATITYLSGKQEALIGWLSCPIDGKDWLYDGTHVRAYTAGMPHLDLLNG